jgi:pimeloyl-ACP methyl ester carboxylesterase
MTNSECHEIRLRDGRALAYAEYGSPHGLPIIHCHGTPSSRVEGDLTFSGTIAAELGLRIIVPDRPGMGRSDFQKARRIVDWPNDVLELATALELDTFAVLGSSGGAPYAAACGALIPNRVRVVGLLGGVAPLDGPGVFAAMSAPLRIMVRLSRFAPAVLRGMFRLNLRAMRSGGQRGSDRMAASFPEPDRSLLRRPEIRDGFMACFEESCRQGPRGPVWDVGLMARPWGFDLAAIRIPVLLWQGERDGNVPLAHGQYLAGAISTCRATFYPDEAHLSLPLNHQREILNALRGEPALTIGKNRSA